MRGPSHFRKNDLKRALQVARETGGGSVEIDPVTGKITVRLDRGESAKPVEINEWDEEYGADKTQTR
jgi:hypothetical protein